MLTHPMASHARTCNASGLWKEAFPSKPKTLS